ncbi:hypothetical protein KPE82_08135 [Acinetobacter baumannii]|uniref:phosphoribosyltransferase-like protein n=1 Tax=Acinetobacter baumannii TaxID=470 RepID=UPI001C0CA765|nr:hypothetical protein [Acinetobacter baumannii]MBU3081571.1 hypothetical protein [Acinetobacter baumannii]MBU3095577.1 hypothetical protein [Acinetobacter baumannii]
MNSDNSLDDIDYYFTKLQLLSQNVWDYACERPQINKWLSQFNGQVLTSEEEQKYMICALSKFMYFSQRMVREMLISLYRDYVRSSIIQKIRKENSDTRDLENLNGLYQQDLKNTLFIGVGNPAESGAHLLYIFRQVNDLEKDLFSDLHGAFDIKSSQDGDIPNWTLREKYSNVKRLIFFDDFVGGGTQASRYLAKPFLSIRKNYPSLEITFISLFSTTDGLKRLNEPSIFDGKAICLFELDETFKSCSEKSRYFEHTKEWFEIEKFKSIVQHYGNDLYPDGPLGHSNCELLIGFSHNTPNNTLPVFWKNGYTTDNTIWHPIFARFDKNYGLGVKKNGKV